MRCLLPTNFMQWQDKSVQLEAGFKFPPKVRLIFANATQPDPGHPLLRSSHYNRAGPAGEFGGIEVAMSIYPHTLFIPETAIA